MGFSAEQAKHGLEQCNGSIERAIDWLFNHPDEIQEQEIAKIETSSSSSGTKSFFDIGCPPSFLNAYLEYQCSEYKL